MSLRRTLGIGLVAAVLLVGCSGGDDDGGEDAAAPSTTATTAASECASTDATSLEPRSQRTLDSGGAEREYVLELPDGYDGTEPFALILDFHGFSSSGPEQADYSQLGSIADAIVVTPTGTGNAWDLRPVADNPELSFTRDLVDEVSHELCVDPDRIYATGISNGSVFSALLACQETDLFAAVALVAATVGPELVGCGPDTTMPLLVFHGTEDQVGAYAGGPSGTLTAPVMESLGIWAERNGCEDEPVEEEIGDDVVHFTYEGCVADVEHYRIVGGGHVWPGAGGENNTESIDASEIISDWFLDHPKTT